MPDPRLRFWPGWHSELFCRWANLGHVFPLGSALCFPLAASLMRVREFGPTVSSSNGNKRLLVIAQTGSKCSRKGDFFGRAADCNHGIQLITYCCQWCSPLSYRSHLLCSLPPFPQLCLWALGELAHLEISWVATVVTQRETYEQYSKWNPWQEGILKPDLSSRITPEEKFFFYLLSWKVSWGQLSPFLLSMVFYKTICMKTWR